MSLLKGQIAGVKAGASTTVFEGGGGGGGGVLPGNGPGVPVNNQSGVTTYVTVFGDDGTLIVFSDASAIAVSLTTQTPPWSCFISNQGAGTVTLTPITGTISYAGNPGAASMPVPGGFSGFAAFDGTNWWGEVASNSSGSGGTITGVTAGTGLTGGGTSGSVTLAIAATAVTPGNYTNTNLTVNAEGQITAAANGSGSSGYLKGVITINFGGNSTGTFTGSTSIAGVTAGLAVAYAADPLFYQSFFCFTTVAGAVHVTVFLNSSIGLNTVNIPVAVFP
jgi:phage shock protein PspC (stress-responsive transcriptional regulator)